MNILVTGAKGFVGKNLCESLKNIRDGKDRTRPWLSVGEVFCFDIDTPGGLLKEYCEKADFVVNLAGVNRPKDASGFRTGNEDFAVTLTGVLERTGKKVPVIFSSSVQATLAGRFGRSEYGLSKKASEDIFFAYGERTGAEVYVYRFPNVAGKWCRPNYNSAVATFCHNVSRGLPVTVNDKETELEILFVEDLCDEIIDYALPGKPHRCEFEGTTAVFCESGRYCACPVTYRAKLGRIVDTLYTFADFQNTLVVPEMPEGSFEKKLFSTYVSFLPAEKASFAPKTNSDARGSFTELIKGGSFGQVSVNITKPGVTKGLHWHNSKWEIFTVVSGKGLIRQRKIGTDEVTEFEVSGEDVREVFMLPGYTHSITNLSDSEDLVTVMYANEIFDANDPDTFREEV